MDGQQGDWLEARLLETMKQCTAIVLYSSSFGRDGSNSIAMYCNSLALDYNTIAILLQ